MYKKILRKISICFVRLTEIKSRISTQDNLVEYLCKELKKTPASSVTRIPEFLNEKSIQAD